MSSGLMGPERNLTSRLAPRRGYPLRILPLPSGGTDVPPHPPWVVGSIHRIQKSREGQTATLTRFLERAMGVEPTTLCLGSRCSTTELRPLAEQDYTTPTAPSPTRSSAGRRPFRLRPR